ncbi:chromosome segregation protein [Carpediemonas membranifera]|uniref:Chromosome segregation protein n=1 Tax=Carpediemonas membranifera TaxID=201153 RepID=A0A8J6BE17_9EUKA|nr:chromosome segregation protein [Carpediemonas membranifera]|eukprot:KAG9395532.1 chromosome segregation protein [Carpediemonas membranifera]
MAITALESRLATSEEDIVLLKEQRELQAEEIRKADSMQETFEEKLVEFAKKRAQVDRDIVTARQGLEARNIAYTRQHEALEMKRRQRMDHEATLRGLQAEIRASQLSQATMQQRVRQIDQTIVTERRKLADSKQRNAALDEEAVELADALEAMSRDTEQSRAEASKALREKEQEDKAYRKAVEEKRKLEEELSEKQNDVRGLSAETAQYQTDTRKMMDEIYGTHEEIAKTENDIARLRMDQMSIDGRIMKLSAFHDELEAEISSQQDLLSQYDRQMTQMTDEIAKRSKEQDALNKKLGELTKRGVDENTGPLESTIASLTNEIQHVADESELLQQRWLSAQAQSVSTKGEIEATRAKLDSVSRDLSTLATKRDRLNAAVDEFNRQIKTLARTANDLHLRHQGLNEQLAAQKAAQEKRSSEVRTLEMEMAGELAAWEEKYAQLDEKRLALETAHDLARENLALSEAENMQIQRNLTMQKEMQEALDPKEGQGELEMLRREITRMKKNLSDLEKSINELKRRTMLQLQRNKNELDKSIAQIINRDKLKRTGQPTRSVDNEIKALHNKKAELQAEVENAEAMNRALLAERAKIDAALESMHSEFNETTAAIAQADKDKRRLIETKAVLDKATHVIEGFQKLYANADSLLAQVGEPEEVAQRFERYTAGVRGVIQRLTEILEDGDLATNAKVRLSTLVRSCRGTLLGCAMQLDGAGRIEEMLDDAEAVERLLTQKE